MVIALQQPVNVYRAWMIEQDSTIMTGSYIPVSWEQVVAYYTVTRDNSSQMDPTLTTSWSRSYAVSRGGHMCYLGRMQGQ